jgi:DNA-binding CsgD family transcriptional regulator
LSNSERSVYTENSAHFSVGGFAFLLEKFFKIFLELLPKKSVLENGIWNVPRKQQRRKRKKSRARAMVLAWPKGEIQFADSAARRWLRQFFGRPPRVGILPRKINRWLSSHSRTTRPRSLLAKKGKTRLYVKREDSYSSDTLVLLLELIKGDAEERFRHHRTLTPREREVLFWLKRGKSNAEISAILGIATATVSKHLERIYPKLGVENRAGAASSLG